MRELRVSGVWRVSSVTCVKSLLSTFTTSTRTGSYSVGDTTPSYSNLAVMLVMRWGVWLHGDSQLVLSRSGEIGISCCCDGKFIPDNKNTLPVLFLFLFGHNWLFLITRLQEECLFSLANIPSVDPSEGVHASRGSQLAHWSLLLLGVRLPLRGTALRYQGRPPFLYPVLRGALCSWVL